MAHLAGVADKCPGYDMKQSNGEAPAVLKLWGMWSISLLPSLPGPLWLGMVALDRVLSMGEIEFNSLLMLNSIVWNRTLCMYKNGFGIGWPTIVDMP